ncbi:MAG: hypothetical protein ACOCT0_02415 [Halobacteriota archaeon]
MNTATTMGAALVVFGVALALVSGGMEETYAVALGVAGAVLLVYMGVGLYSRGRSDADRLHEIDSARRRSAVESTSSYVAGAGAALALLGFVGASASDAGWLPQAVFGAAFVYLAFAFTWMRRREDV